MYYVLIGCVCLASISVSVCTHMIEQLVIAIEPDTTELALGMTLLLMLSQVLCTHTHTA